jgi:HlyD family secretion protein
VSTRNKFAILIGIILLASLAYYLFSTPHSKDLVLIGTVDANQVIVSPQVEGRLSQLLVDEGSRVKQGDLLAVLDPSELEAEERAAAANITGLQSKVSQMRSTEEATQGSTSSSVVNAQAKLASAKAQLLQAQATLQRTQSDSQRTIALAKDGVASDQERVQAETNLQAQQALVQSLEQQVSAADADVKTAVANTHQARAAQDTVQATLADLANAKELQKEAQVKLGYTKIYAPVNGVVSVRAALQGEVLNAGQAIVTIVDLGDTWVRAAIPETYADHIGMGDTLRIQLPGGTITSGKVFYKSPEADFATQRDVSRMKRDIKTIVLKVRLENPDSSYVPGMTANILVSPEQMKGKSEQASASTEQRP